MRRKKVLITVVTYPLPSRSYDELVCTAGILENGNWIRIYPVPFSFLWGQRQSGEMESYKYTWIELSLKRRSDDFRPESYSPANYNFHDLKVLSRVDTRSNWAERKKLCLQNVYTNMDQLIQDSQSPKNVSLATFKPEHILELVIEETDREWKDEWVELRKQRDLFSPDRSTEIPIKKLPYKFYYRFLDTTGKERRMMIEDWEIGQLYWNCLESAKGDEEIALKKVRQRYETEFVKDKEIHFFLGTTRQWHFRRSRNPFVIIGVFYPKFDPQMNLFE